MTTRALFLIGATAVGGGIVVSAYAGWLRGAEPPVDGSGWLTLVGLFLVCGGALVYSRGQRQLRQLKRAQASGGHAGGGTTARQRVEDVPVVVLADEGLLTFASMDDFTVHAEAIDVENGVYEAVFDAHGQGYVLTVDEYVLMPRPKDRAARKRWRHERRQGRPEFRVAAADRPADPDALAGFMRRQIAARPLPSDPPAGELASMTVDELFRLREPIY